MKKVISFILCVAIGVGIIYGVGYQAKRLNPPDDKILTVPSFFEIQELLNEIEPENPIKVDGRIGKKTLEKWDRVYCQQCANMYFN